MKKNILRKIYILFLLIVVLSLKGNTQSLKTDSSTISNKDLQKVLKAAQLSKLYKEEIQSKNVEIDLYKNRINIKDSTIDILNLQLDNCNKTVSLVQSNYKMEQEKYKAVSQTLKEYKLDSDRQIKKLNKQKVTKTIGSTIVGIAVGILAGTFLIK